MMSSSVSSSEKRPNLHDDIDGLPPMTFEYCQLRTG